MISDSKKTLTNHARGLDIVVLAVFLLGGEKKSIDTEDVAVKAHELVAGMFAWQKYPKQINLELVRVTLSDAKKPRNGSLLSGSGKLGWRLTSNGLQWAKSRGEELINNGFALNGADRKAGSVDVRRMQREKKRISMSSAWQNWTTGQEITVDDARQLFRIDEYSTSKMQEIKIVRLQSLFKDDLEMARYIELAAELILVRRES